MCCAQLKKWVIIRLKKIRGVTVTVWSEVLKQTVEASCLLLFVHNYVFDSTVTFLRIMRIEIKLLLWIYCSPIVFFLPD